MYEQIKKKKKKLSFEAQTNDANNETNETDSMHFGREKIIEIN